jgi:chromosome partitioning protein
MGEVISIASQKGGVGKTTTAVNLGVSLAYLGNKVLLIDIDPQGSVASSFGYGRYDTGAGIMDVFTKDVPITAAIYPTGQENYNFVPTNLWAEESDRSRLADVGSKIRLRDALAPIRDEYQFILIDCPPSLGNLTFNALTASDSLLVPIQCEYYALKALGRFLKLTRIIKNENNPGLKYRGFLLTMVDQRNKLTGIVIEKVRYTLQGLVLDTMIPRNVRLAEVPYHGKPVVGFDKNCKGAKSYLNLAHELLGDGLAVREVNEESLGESEPEREEVQVVDDI